MNGKAALVIIYDYHQHHVDYIPQQEKAYGGRFSDIYHLVPALPGFAPSADLELIGANVIPVHGKPYRFQGYIAQGLQRYFREEYTHYLFIHYRLIWNARISQDSFCDHLRLDGDTAFFPEFSPLHQTLDWAHTSEAYAFRLRSGEDAASLPAYEQALGKFAAHGLEIKPVSFHWRLLLRGHYAPPRPPANALLQPVIAPLRWARMVFRRLKRLATWSPSGRELAYPLVGGFSDALVVPAINVAEFCRYCGAFADANLPATIALPTAVALSCDKVSTRKNIADATPVVLPNST